MFAHTKSKQIPFTVRMVTGLDMLLQLAVGRSPEVAVWKTVREPLSNHRVGVMTSEMAVKVTAVRCAEVAGRK